MVDDAAVQGLDVGALYVRYAGLVRRRVRRFYDAGEVDEVVQEVFLRALEQRHRFRAESSPATWLYAITTHHCLNRLRDSARRSELLAQHGEQAPSGAPPAAAEHALLIGELWRQLPDDLLEIGVYYHVDGMSHDEIAAILGVSRRTIGNRLEELTQRARALIEV